MFGELVPEDVIGKLAELRCASVVSEWRRSRKQSKKNAVERIRTEGILANLCGRQTLLSHGVFSAHKCSIKSRILLRHDDYGQDL